MDGTTAGLDDKTGMMGLIRDLLRPYRGSLAVILLAMLVQSTMTLAAPWPLKIVLDNVVVSKKLDPWMAALLKPFLVHGHRIHLAEVAALAVVLIALLNAAASYTPLITLLRASGSGWPTICACGLTTICNIFRFATMTRTNPACCSAPLPPTC